MDKVTVKVIQSWTTAGDDRLVGVIFGLDGSSNGRTVITSPVARVLFRGAPPLPVAITASGSEYCLGQPSEKVKGETPEQFVMRKSADPVVRDRVTGDEVASTTYVSQGS